MKISRYLILLAIFIILIFGGIFSISYFRTGEILIDQIVGIVVGVVLLLAILIWRK